MTTFQNTLATYKNSKSMAFLAFQQDPTGNEGVTFSKFCEGMDKIIGSVRSVNPMNGKVEVA
jgi:hypothetical protein